MAKQVKDVYGNALFEVAVEEDKISEYYDEVKAVRQAIAENGDLLVMMAHPEIHEEDKVKALSEIFESRVSSELYGLLCMMHDKGHFADVCDVLDYFMDRVKEHRNIGVAYVSTPTALDAVQQKAVEDKLIATTGYVSIEPHYEVDESLIGGMVIRIGDRVVDSSIKTKLEKLSHQLSTGR
jgi:F-type H+-transporting ATPase subunit delta